MGDLNLSKEEKERIVNERIEQIRKKNELLKKRYEEVQTDKKIFESQKSKDQVEGIEVEVNYRGKLESDRANDLWKGRGRGRARAVGDSKQDQGVGRHANNAAYEAWRAERERIDSERLSRQKTTDGNWKREWDQNKIVADDDKVDRRRPVPEEPYYENRRAPRNQKLGDFIPRQRNGDRPAESRSFYRQRPKSGHDEWRSTSDKTPQADGDENWDAPANQVSPGNVERKSAERQYDVRRQNRGPRSPQNQAQRYSGQDQNQRYERSGQDHSQRYDRAGPDEGQRYERLGHDRPQRYDRSPQKGRFDKPVSPRKEGRNRDRSERQEQPREEGEINERKKSQRSDLRSKLEAIRAKKAQESARPAESQPVPQFDLRSPVRSVEVSGDTLRVVIPNEVVTSTPTEPESPSLGPASLTATEQPSSLMFEGEFFEDDYIHEHVGDSFEDNSKSWETASEDEYSDAEAETSSRSVIPELELYKSADSGDASFVSAEGRDSQQSVERKYERFDLLVSAKDMMLRTFEMYQNAEWEVLEYGDLVGLKSSGLCCAWGAHGEEDIQTLQHFMEAPFLYHHTKDEFAPSGDYPRTTWIEMAIKLASFNQAFYVENLTVRVDNDEDQIRKFTDVVARCFSLSSDTVWSELKYIPEDYILAYQNGELVGGLLVTVIGESSIIYYNSVLPKFRGQNISKAVMAEAIKVAKEKGAKQMVLLASALGEPVYKALGFKYIKEWTRSVIGPLAHIEDSQDAGDLEQQQVMSQADERPESSELRETASSAANQTINSEPPIDNSGASNLYRMSTAVADIVETDGESVTTRYGPWGCVYSPKSLEHVRKIYQKFQPVYLDVHFHPGSIPKWAELGNYSDRYSMACDLENVLVEDDSEFVTTGPETDEQFRLCAQMASNNFGFGPSFLGALETMFRAAVQRGATVLIAHDESEASGCGIVEYSSDVAAVYFFSVNTQFRRKGVGTRLVRRFVKIAKEKGLKEAVLLAEGDIAKSLYEKAGFKVFDSWKVMKYEPAPEESECSDYIELDCSAISELGEQETKE